MDFDTLENDWNVANLEQYEFPPFEYKMSTLANSTCIWSESIVDTKTSILDMECVFPAIPEGNSLSPNSFEPDGVLFLHSDRTSPDAVLYLTDDREFVATDYPSPDSSDSFDVSELYSSKEATTFFDVNELYSVQKSVKTECSVHSVHPAPKDTISTSLPPLSLPIPVSSSYSKSTTLLPSFCITSPDYSPKSQPCILLGKPVLNLPPSPNFMLPRSASDARPSFVAQIQTTVWGHQDRAQYFSGEVRKAQIHRYKEKKASRYINKRSVDAARSKVAKQRLRNSKGRFVVRNAQSTVRNQE